MKLKVKEIVFCGMFAALIAVGAFIKITIPMPAYDMHFTLQWFFVLMAAFLLGEKLAPISVGVYLLLGLIGLPIFAAGGGPAYVLRPGFGFLLGFLLAAWVMGFMTNRLGLKKYWQKILTSVVGLVIYYGIGALYFYLMYNLYTVGHTAGSAPMTFGTVVLTYCVSLTVLPDLALCILAVSLSHKLYPVLRKFIYEEKNGVLSDVHRS